LAFLLAVLLAAGLHLAPDADHPLAAELLGRPVGLLGRLRVEHDLRDAAPSPQIHEDQVAVVEPIGHPPEASCFPSNVTAAQSAAIMGAFEFVNEARYLVVSVLKGEAVLARRARLLNPGFGLARVD